MALRAWAAEDQARIDAVFAHTATAASSVNTGGSAVAQSAAAVLPNANLDPYDTLGYLKRLFEPGDEIDLQFIHQTETWPNGRKKTADRFMSVNAVNAETVAYISRMQAQGWNAYVAMNAFTHGLKSRRVCDVKAIRSVYLDFDSKPASDLFKADVAAGTIPEPQFVIQSSPKKFYVEWLVKDFTVEEQEGLNRALQQRYGSDAASTDAARVLRLPGTRNLKYPEQPLVKIIKQSQNERYSPSDFKIERVCKAHRQIDAVADEKLQSTLDLMKAALDEAEVGYNSITEDSDDPAHRIKIVLDECLWGRAPEHHQNGDPTGAAIFISADGTLGYKCFHDWCQEHYHWNECRAKLEELAGHKLQFGEPVSIPMTSGGKTVEQIAEESIERNKRREEAENFEKLVRSSKAVKLIAYLSDEDAQTIEQQQQPIRIQIETPKLITTFGQVVADPAAPVVVSDIPITAMASTRLGDIYSSIFEPNGWPLNYALPALATAASVLVPRFVVPEGHILLGDDNLTNLYTALIGKVHAGKSQCIEWAARALGIYHEDCAEHYLDVSAGSAEQLIDALDKRKNTFKNSVLIDQDEWAQLFAKADIPNATFPAFLTKSFYRRRQIFTRPRGKEVVLNLAMSFCGGIVEDDFDSVFNALTLGGCYDRFLFGRMPQDWVWAYRPFPRENGCQAIDELLPWEPIPVFLDGSVFEVGQAWAKQNPDLGRITEICIRIATIFASMDGRERVTGKDLEVLSGLAAYQLDLRRQFQPNAGQNADAQFANAALRWINRHAEDWTSISLLKKGVHTYEQKLGPNVAERALFAMARGGQIDLWLNKGEPVVLPADYHGALPRIGLVRRVKAN